jgi:hypothetical protein
MPKKVEKRYVVDTRGDWWGIRDTNLSCRGFVGTHYKTKKAAESDAEEWNAEYEKARAVVRGGE